MTLQIPIETNMIQYDAQISNKVIIGVQELKKLKFSSEICKVLKNNSSSNGDTFFIEEKTLDIENGTPYLGDVLMAREMILHCAKIEQILRQLVQLLNFYPFVRRQILGELRYPLY